FASAWDAAHANPLNFTGWVALVERAETAGPLENVEAAFSAFLQQFPLCYGFYLRWAAASMRWGTASTETDPIFERGVQAVPSCPELWEAYIVHVTERASAPRPYEEVREIFRRAADAVG
ncbi:unnamed protein product, partial [Phaeothamnion confervicola]